MEFTRFNSGNIETDLFEEAIDIWNQSFPDEEKVELDVIIDTIKNNEKHFFYAVQDDERTLGLLAFEQFPEVDTTFVDYFAVREEFRRKGIGSSIIKKFLTEFLTTDYAVLDTRRPDTNEARRRIEFYERLGFTATDFRYFQPPFGKIQYPIPFKFLYHSKSGKVMSDMEFKDIVKVIYQKSYHTKDTENLIHSLYS